MRCDFVVCGQTQFFQQRCCFQQHWLASECVSLFAAGTWVQDRGQLVDEHTAQRQSCGCISIVRAVLPCCCCLMCVCCTVSGAAPGEGSDQSNLFPCDLTEGPSFGLPDSILLSVTAAHRA